MTEDQQLLLLLLPEGFPLPFLNALTVARHFGVDRTLLLSGYKQWLLMAQLAIDDMPSKTRSRAGPVNAGRAFAATRRAWH